MLKTYILKNGIKVATYNLPGLKSLHLRIIIKAGSLNEQPSNNGVAHFMEHILVQGIPSYPNVEALSSFIESLAGTYGAYTSPLFISFNITVPSSYLDESLKIASEVMFEPLFPENSIEKERTAILSEIAQRRDSHYYKLGEFFRNSRFIKNHPLTMDTVGSPEVVEKLTRANLVSFWKDYFFTTNAYLIIVGNIDEKKLTSFLKRIDQNYSKKVSPKNLKMSNRDFNRGGVFIRQDNNLQTVYVGLSLPSLNLNAPIRERVLHNLANASFGRLRNSRLFKLLRYKKGLVYEVSSDWNSYPGLGYVSISSQTSPENLDEVLNLIVGEIKSFVTKGLSIAEIEFAKNFLINQWLMSFDHPRSIADWIDSALIWENKVRLVDEYINMLKKVTPEEILSLLQKYWDYKKLSLIIQGPIEETDSNTKKYQKVLRGLK